MSQPLSEVDKCVIQILTSKGLVEDTQLDGYIQSVVLDFQSRDALYQPIQKDQMFKHINNNIRQYAMEIKTIIDASDTTRLVYYHGLVNTEEDFVAKNFGSNGLDQVEITFFTDLATKLLQYKRFSTRDVEDLPCKPRNWSASDVGKVLEKLYLRKWLKRDDRNYWILGLRSYLELRTFLEGVVSNPENEIDDDTGTIDSFPQVIVY